MIDLLMQKCYYQKRNFLNESPNKIVHIIEKILNFNNQQKRKGIKILTPRQVKYGDTSENLLSGICQIKYSLHQEKEVTKKVRNNIINSIQL